MRGFRRPCASARSPARSAAAAKRVPADLYIAHYPAALPAAAIAARRHGALYAFDAEDFHLGDWPEGPGASSSKRRLIRAIEGRYLPGCAYVTAASPGIADAYAEAYGIARPTVAAECLPPRAGAAGPDARRDGGAGTVGLLVLADDRSRSGPRMRRAGDWPRTRATASLSARLSGLGIYRPIADHRRRGRRRGSAAYLVPRGTFRDGAARGIL